MTESLYNTEKSMYYTEQLIEFVRNRWGDIPLSPQTFTWADGTVSIIIEHNMCDKYHPSLCMTARMNFQETGFRGAGEMQIRETIEKGVGSDGSVVWEEYLPVTEIIETYD